jgi:tetratricopeptide (TPR) repeat protein
VGKLHPGISLAAVLLCALFALHPTLDNGFTSWDDPTYVTENPDLRAASERGYGPALGRTIQGNYHPLTMLSLAWDHSRAVTVDDAGQATLDAAPFHLSSLLLHLVNTGLVFWLALALAGGRPRVAAFCALFFAVHPAHVESVAWISARKDLLYTLFFLAASIVYLRYRSDRRPWLYACCLVLFVASLLSKPAAVVLPVVLILFDLYLDGRFERARLLDKLPLLGGSLILGFVTLQGQTEAGAVYLGAFHPLERILLASYAFVAYIGKLFLPVGLSAFYPYPVQIDGRFWLALVATLAVAGLASWAFRRSRELFFAIGFLAVNLALVVQLLPVGAAIIAERYTYLAYVGPLFALGMGLDRLLRREGPLRYAAAGVAIVLAVASIWAARERAAVWRDSLTLWSSVIERFPDTAFKAYSARGVHYREQGEPEKALADYDRAIAIAPGYANTYLSRANLYRDLGRRSENPDYFRRAVQDLDRAIELDPAEPAFYNSRALAYGYLGATARALDDYATALRLDPAHVDAHQNRARLYRAAGDFDRAYDDYTAVTRYRPHDPVSWLRRADTALMASRMEEALADFTRCIEIAPAFGDCYLGRAQVHDRMGHGAAAQQDLQSARTLAR